MHFPLEGLSKVLGSGLGSAWFRLGSTRAHMHFPLEGLSKVLGSRLGSAWFRLGSTHHWKATRYVRQEK